MFSRSARGNRVAQTAKRISCAHSQRRLISSSDMFEAFDEPSSIPKPKSTSTRVSTFKSAKKVDPVININRDFSVQSASYNSTNTVDKSNISNVSAINDVFNKSLNDFEGLKEQPILDGSKNWSESFHGLGNAPFSKEAQEVLYTELTADDIEITPDGLLYLPEIKYRRILNRAFGAGAWGLAPRSETLVQMQENGGLLTREYGLVIHGRLVSIARGEQTFFKEQGIPTATEGCKSNALMRCCKDLGIASELWDPRFIKKFKKNNCENIFVEYIPTKKKKKIWKRKDEDVDYPFKR